MTIGKLVLPLIALGTWAWGDSGEIGNGYFGSHFSEESLKEVVEKAHAAGLYLWDTAVVYGMGRSEALLGDLLKHYRREEYQELEAIADAAKVDTRGWWEKEM